MNGRKSVCAVLFVLTGIVALAGCSTDIPLIGSAKHYSESGTIILSRGLGAVPEGPSVVFGNPGASTPMFAPLLGYVPPSIAFVPAQNETWIKLDRKSNTLTVLKGASVVKEIQGEGAVDLEPGVYSLQFKQKDPSWYAPDDYFVKRHLVVPPEGDSRRFRRGALGTYALYPTATFAVHSGSIWSKDVGGLKISKSELSSIYYLLPLGASVQVE
jgi:hypothetical protein